MKTKIFLTEEHLYDCSYGYRYDKYEHIEQCYCFNNDQFVKYFINKYPHHMASIAQRDKDIKEIYAR